MKVPESRFGECIYFSSNALARKIEKMAIETWKKVDLAPSHAYLLMLIIDGPGSQPSTLSGEMRLTPSTITRLIEKLEGKKLVVRITEGKLTNVYPTPRAKELKPALEQCAKEFYDKYCDILGKEESDRMARNMIRIADKLGD